MSRHYDPREEERQRQEIEQAKERKRLRDQADYSWLMSDARGRRLMWDWLAFCGMYKTSFRQSGSETAFNEGMRNVGLMLNEGVMLHAEDMYVVMQKEAREAPKSQE